MSGEQTGLQGQGLVKRLTDVAAYLSEGLVGPCAEWAETTSDMARPLLIAANLLRRAPAQKYHVSDPNHAPGCPLRTFVYEVGSGAVYPDCTCRTVIGDCEDCEQPIYHDEPYDRWADDILTHRTCAPTQEEGEPKRTYAQGYVEGVRDAIDRFDKAQPTRKSAEAFKDALDTAYDDTLCECVSSAPTSEEYNARLAVLDHFYHGAFAATPTPPSAEVEEAIAELEQEIQVSRGLDVTVELSQHNARAILAALRGEGGG